MKTPAAPRRAKRMKPEAPESPEQECKANISALPATSAPNSIPRGAGGDEPYIQDPPPGAAGEEEDGVDRISLLPDAILGEVISLLPTKDAARTQILATRWRHLWRSAPLNLDGVELRSIYVVPRVNHDGSELRGIDVISRILSAHRGPGRRFRFAIEHLQDHPATVDAWLRSPALDNLQEIDCWIPYIGSDVLQQPPLPASTFWFSSSLCVATFSQCHLSDDVAQTLQFPKLKKLALKWVTISEDSLHSIIAGSPVLECLLLSTISGFRCVRINSASLTSIGVGANGFEPTVTFLEELIVEDAPCLKRILYLPSSRTRTQLQVSVVSAPNLETLGSLSCANRYKLALGSMIIESSKCGDKNLWCRKHHNFIKCHDIRLKTVVLTNYRGIRSQVNFATFFVLNAKMLESMTFQCRRYFVTDRFLAEQHQLLQLENKASRCARFYFTIGICRFDFMHINHAHDLSKTDPFECEETCWVHVCASFE